MRGSSLRDEFDPQMYIASHLNLLRIVIGHEIIYLKCYILQIKKHQVAPLICTHCITFAKSFEEKSQDSVFGL